MSVSLALGTQGSNYLIQKQMIYLTATVVVAVPLVVWVFGISDIMTPSHNSWMALKKMKKKILDQTSKLRIHRAV